jgi:hypothetical protein
VGITTSTHFAKPKLGQKHNSLHAKNSKNAKIHSNHIKNKDQKKDTSNFPKEDFKFVRKQWGPKKKENSKKTS